MIWANVFHIYQPAGQQPDILEAVVNESYRPLIRGIEANPHVRVTINIPGALLELFDTHGYSDLIDLLRTLGKNGQIEFTGTAKYHAFLPLIPDEEVVRQIQSNDKTNKFFLGDAYKPRGFFPPEMAYAPHLAPIIEQLGYEWIILDEIAHEDSKPEIDNNTLYTIAGTNLNVFFRERRMSNLIMSAVVRTQEALREAVRDDIRLGKHTVTAMDGETFGHHRPGLEQGLFDMLSAKDFQLMTLSELRAQCTKKEGVTPIASTWASSPTDIAKKIQFLSWLDPENPIHTIQWKFVNMVLEAVHRVATDDKEYSKIRNDMDIALASDHFWWASAKPWWSLEMIEEGAFRLLQLVRKLPNVESEILDRAREYYETIVSTAFLWQRNGLVRQATQEQKNLLRIPFKERTLEKGGVETGVYQAFISMMRRLEQDVAQKGEYEQAILWRDAIHKIEHKNDIYDAISAIDLLRTKIPHEEVESIIMKYKADYARIRGGQPEQRGG